MLNTQLYKILSTNNELSREQISLLDHLGLKYEAYSLINPETGREIIKGKTFDNKVGFFNPHSRIAVGIQNMKKVDIVNYLNTPLRRKYIPKPTKVKQYKELQYIIARDIKYRGRDLEKAQDLRDKLERVEKSLLESENEITHHRNQLKSLCQK